MKFCQSQSKPKLISWLMLALFYIPNLSLLLCLEALEKFVVVVVGWGGLAGVGWGAVV